MLAGPVNVAICSDCVIAACDQTVDYARRSKPVGRDVVFSEKIDVRGLPDHLLAVIGRASIALTLAQERFPAPNYSLLKVAEEAGEFIKAAVHYGENRGSWEDVEAEAVQAIAMILRVLDEGDGVNRIAPPRDRRSDA
ncbi:hypothetical protein [Gemmobacter nectariphilus]|uniref:hypothetical protein n=1 Tax=Gemmobacter nectariphilus TaxID=220343 RepID=UPI0004849EDE